MKLTGLLSRLAPVRVLLIGDFMLDAYTIGVIERISPEAPVPILHAKHEENRPGGAGNVALGLVSLGAQVFAVGRVGADEAGRALFTQLYEEGVEVDGLLSDPRYKTPKKNRLIAAAQQIMRIDFEENIPCSEELEERLIVAIENCIDEVDIIAVSDYGKGLFVPSLLEKIISLGKEKNLPVIIDPKGTDFTKYRNATLIKPNLKETKLASGLHPNAPLSDMAAKILESTGAAMLLVTKSNDGMSLFFPDGEAQDFPVRSREVKDVTGAGDTVLAMICVALANRFPIETAVHLANLAAGIAIERIGCARITLTDLASRLLEVDRESKVFDEEHLFALREALRGEKSLLVSLEGVEEQCLRDFRHLHALSQSHKDSFLIVYVRSSAVSDTYLSLLSSLKEVDFLVLPGKALESLVASLEPALFYEIAEGELFLKDKVVFS